MFEITKYKKLKNNLNGTNLKQLKNNTFKEFLLFINQDLFFNFANKLNLIYLKHPKTPFINTTVNILY